MSSSPAVLPATKRPPVAWRYLIIIYLLIALVPYCLSFTQGLELRGWYPVLITVLNIAGLTAIMLQFALSGRFEPVADRAGIDNGMSLHRKAGQVLALFFFLHPVLIVLPRLWIAPAHALENFWTAVTAPEALTGVFAWSLMAVWVLMAINRDRLGMSYEAWRISHGAGFIAIIILATHHAATVGRHGRYEPWFDVMWIAMCTVAVASLLFTYIIRPLRQKEQPFQLVEANKIGSSDWCLTIEKAGDFDFAFDAGQFVWINTTGNPFNRAEHPFSIASSPAALPRISFVIRELGDFSSNLDRLEPGQAVYVDGPHGTFTLTGRKAKGTALIAGGVGIGPILGILRQLRDIGDRRPVRLVYGNRVMEQMVYQDEIAAMSGVLEFEQVLALEDPPDGFTGHKGRLDRTLLEETFSSAERKEWDFYVCGPPVMVQAVSKTLKRIGVPRDRILLEQLAF
ncbi:MAG: ferredoxin reductase family protein [bacterium]|nr:ferredoxin reductase family protein [bacterium]